MLASSMTQRTFQKLSLVFKIALILVSFSGLQLTVKASDCEEEGGCKKQFNQINKFARRGSPHAQILMGAFYHDGTHVKKDLRKSFMWYRKAAKQRPAIGLANHKVALAFLDGVGVKQNFKQSIIYLEKAAKTGYIKSQILLAMLLLDGKVIEKDYLKAKYWLKLSAKQNDPRAAFMLGEMAEKGVAGEQNLEKALKWYFVAADAGYPKAMEKIQQFKIVTNKKVAQPAADRLDSAKVKDITIAENQSQAKGEVMVIYANDLSVTQMLDITLDNIKDMKVYSTQWTGSHLPGRGCGDGMTRCSIITDPEIIRKMMR